MDKDLIFVQTMLSDELVVEGFPLVYKGPLNHQTMKFFTSMAEEKISKRCNDLKAKRTIFHVMVEMLQNVTRHSAGLDDEGIGNGVFVIGERSSYYYIITGNMILSSKVKELEEAIERLNMRDREELDNMHKEQMKYGALSEKGGAGLGLIDIVRKTREHLAYQFLRLDKSKHFFILKATIPFSSNPE